MATHPSEFSWSRSFRKWRSRFVPPQLIAPVALLLSGALFNGAIDGTASTASGPSLPATCAAIPFNAVDFADPTTIDNQYFPLIPGMQLSLKGRADFKRHHELFTVTDLTKTMGGVKTLVIWDQDFSQGRIQEAELAFFAQDDAGNVWLLGEYPEVYKHGKFSGAPDTWIIDHAGSEAGIQMPGDPKVGDPPFPNANAPDVGFLDCAQIIKTDARTRVPAGSFDSLVVTQEWSPLDSLHQFQLKFNAPGTGLVRVSANTKRGERLHLLDSTTLSPADMEAARTAVRAMDEHACQVHDWYCALPPVE